MAFVLKNRIIKPMFLLPIREYLCPIILIASTKNPTAIIFHLKHNYSDPRHYDSVDLRILLLLTLHIQVMIYCYWWNTMFKQIKRSFNNECEF